MEIKYKNKQLVNNSEKNKFDLIYPVGYIYTTYDKTFNPNDSFYGTWVKIPYVNNSGALITTGNNFENIIVSRFTIRHNGTANILWNITTNKGTKLKVQGVDNGKAAIILEGGENIIAVHRIQQEGLYPNTENNVIGIMNASNAAGTINAYFWSWGKGGIHGKKTISPDLWSTGYDEFNGVKYKRIWASVADNYYGEFGEVANKQSILYDYWTLKQFGVSWCHSLGNITAYPADFACSFRLEHLTASGSPGGWSFYKRANSATKDTLTTFEVYELADSNTSYQKWLRTA